MTSKFIAARACPASVSSQKSLKNPRRRSPAAQRGLSLIELMVGIAIGLLVVAVAMGALMVSRGISGTVSDASAIQQQGAYAMRTLGMQLRQAGSLRLNLNPGAVVASDPYLVSVAFETKNGDFDATAAEGKGVLEGKENPSATEFKLQIRYSSYTEPLFAGGTESQSRDCIGNNPNSTLLESRFRFVDKELKCASAGTSPIQPIVRNVANFQVNYLVQDKTTAGLAKIKSVDASGVTDWGQVQAVEVCLVLYGDEAIGMTAGSNYTDCDGTTQVDMSTLTGERARRMHVAFRNVFQLRSQGLIGSVL